MADKINPNSFFNQSDDDGTVSNAFSLAQQAFNISNDIKVQMSELIKAVQSLNLDFNQYKEETNNTIEEHNTSITNIFNTITELGNKNQNLTDEVKGISDVFFDYKLTDEGFVVQNEKVKKGIEQRKEFEEDEAADKAWAERDRKQKAGTKKPTAVPASGGHGGAGSTEEKKRPEPEEKGGGGLLGAIGGLFSGAGNAIINTGGLALAGMKGLMQSAPFGGNFSLGGIVDAATGDLTDFDQRGSMLDQIRHKKKLQQLDFKGDKGDKGDSSGGLFGGLFGGGKKEEEKSKIQRLTDAGYNIKDHGFVGGERLITHTSPEHGRNVGGFLGIGGKGKLATKTKSEKGIMTRVGAGSEDSLENIIEGSSLEVQKRSFGNRLLGGVDALTGNLTDFDMKGGSVLGGGLIDAATGNFTDLDRKGGETFGVTRGVTGVADALTGNALDLDKKGEFGEGTKRAVGGFADFATGGMFDFDKKNRKGAPKDFGIRRVAGGVADWATMGVTDFDKRGKGNLQVNPLFGGKDKAWGSADEQAKRREKQSGMGIKRGIGGALDFATLGTFDFDKQNNEGAPKGWGIKRVAGGLADAITAGATDFDKRGTGIGQMKLGEMMSDKKRKQEITEARENSSFFKNNQSKIDSLRGKSSQIPMETTVNPDGSITSKGSGRLVGGELFTPGQPLNAKQYMAIRAGMSMGNTYSNEIMQSYKMHEEQRGKTNDAIQSNTTGSKEFMKDITQPPPTEGDMTPPSEASPPPTDVQGIETGQPENEPNNMPPDAVSIEHPAVGTECQVDCINMLKSNSYYNLGF